MSKNSTVTFTAMRKLLSSMAFKPEEPGPMKVILESGDSNYRLRRSAELIREAADTTFPDVRRSSLIRAIQLAALVLLSEDVHSAGGKRTNSLPKEAATIAPADTSNLIEDAKKGGSQSKESAPSVRSAYHSFD